MTIALASWAAEADHARMSLEGPSIRIVSEPLAAQAKPVPEPPAESEPRPREPVADSEPASR